MCLSQGKQLPQQGVCRQQWLSPVVSLSVLVLVYFKMNTTCLIGSEKEKEKLKVTEKG